MSEQRKEGPSTRSVHGGVQRPDRHHAVPTPIVSTATYTFADSAEVASHMRGEHPDPHREEYGRYGNPTVRALEEKLAALESAEAACATASGMAAIAGVRAAITPRTRLIVGESPTNPYLHCTDLRALAALAKEHRIKTIVDSTFATPINLRPLSFGIDLVVHSATKYLAGHHDVLAGAIVGNAALAGLVRELRGVLGGVLDPHAAFLVARGLKTLGLRVERANATALVVARRLAEHPRVAQVFYPGLPTHPTHAVAAEQMSGFGGVVSFRVKCTGDPLAETSRVVDAFKMARIAPSLGGVDTLVEQPAIMSFYELSSEERLAAGIHDDLIRLAVGVEDEDDVIDDVTRALEAP
jgi:cystathionine gamma-synthase